MAFLGGGEPRTGGSPDRVQRSRWEPLTGIAFVVLFVAGVVTMPSPNDNDANRVWLSYFNSSGHQIQTLVSGFMFVLAALCLIAFVTTLWSRIAEARQPQSTSPLPLVGGGMAAVGIALGGVLEATVSGAMIFGQLRLPPADILRFGNDAAFPAITVAGMFGAALAIGGLAVQAPSSGLFGRRFAIVGLVVAVITIFSFGFFPLVAPLLWFLVVSIMMLSGKRSVGQHATNADSVAAPTP